MSGTKKEQVKLVYDPKDDPNLPWILKFWWPQTEEWTGEIWCIDEFEARLAIIENNLEVIN